MRTKWCAVGEPYDYEELGLEEAREDFNNLWVTLETAGLGLGEAELKVIISIFTSTCKSCMNAPEGCQCWNDE